MQVFIFGAARSNSQLSKDDAQLVLEKLVRGQRVLDWTLHGLNESGIKNEQISFVGGYKVENIIQQYRNLHYVINPKWEETHVVGSLRYAMENWKGGDLLLIYADTIFRPSVFKEIQKTGSSVTIGIDRLWKERLDNLQLKLAAEKVSIKNEKIEKVGRESISIEKADAQFSGLTLLKKDVVQKLYSELFENKTGKAKVTDNDSLTDLIRFIKDDLDVSLTPHDHSGLWAELDSYEDLSRFVFGTKAETLERIRPFVKQSVITDQVHFSLSEWENNQIFLLDTIQDKFRGKKLIVRSSSQEEDSWDSSQAGAFLSVADVDSSNRNELLKSIKDVIEAFQNNGSGQYNEDNQVLVQPFISDVEMSGVAFTKHLENGTPYYLINYDDQSKRTDTVTSGSSSDSTSLTVYKKSNKRPDDLRIISILNALEELETITGYSSLDVEFVLTTSGDLYIVQVRPITTHTGLSEIADFHHKVDEIKNRVHSRLRNHPHIYGDTTILADMPDWNPAEMIGVRPKPLAVSLYQYLITDSAWRNARGRMGYFNPSPERLLFCLGGHPYIDVRNSFNNLIPDGLRPELSDKLINHYIKRLKENPHFHDKVEFDIVITCYTPDIDYHTDRLFDAGFTKEEVQELKDRLKALTEKAITGERLSVKQLIEQTESLNPRREAILKQDYSKEEIPGLIQTLLDDCIENGTIPFSILARYGFIASSMLRGFVRRGVITEGQKDEFLNSIETVAGKLVDDMNGVLTGEYSKEKFLQEYGHLRPGSYDITSYSYREKPEYYFPSHHKDKASGEVSEESISHFTFDEETMRAIENEIERLKLNISTNQLLSFIKAATAGREFAKFQFTKNLDAVLRLLTEWGEEYGFSRDDLSCLFIEDVLRLNTFTIADHPVLYLKQKIQEGKKWHQESNKVETPQLITSPDDLDIIKHNVAEPNYVTSKLVTAPICNLKGNMDKSDLEGKIVLTEGADPGYDWIFLHSIKGLITKYGGSASHMTIRCAEFGLPAAIGCGEELFNRLKGAENVELNCANKQIKVLR